MSPTKVLLVGYDGADNTGSEALLQSDIEGRPCCQAHFRWGP